MSFNLGGALSGLVTGAIAGFVYGGGYGAIVGAIAGFAVGGFALEPLLNALIDIPKVDDGAQRSGKQYNADLQQNQAQLGDVKPVGIGRWKDWYNYRAQPYKEMVDHCEVIHAYLHVTQGECEFFELRVGDTPLESFSGQAMELLAPGQPMTLLHPNVYTNSEATGIELQGGALGVAAAGPCTFDGHSVRLTGSTFLSGLDAGAELTVTGTDSNNGIYTVTDAGGTFVDGKISSYAHVEETFVDEFGVYATLSWPGEDEDAVTLHTELLDGDGDPVIYVFDSTHSEIQVADEKWDGWLDKFRVGDVIGVNHTESTGNDGVAFTVVATYGGSRLLVTPTPGGIVEAGMIYLRRRREGPYFAAPRGEKANRIGIDISFDALGKIDDGDVKTRSVVYEVRYRPVDDADVPIGDWVSQVFVLSDKRLAKRRFSYYIDLDTPIRPQVDLCRVTSDKGRIEIYDDCTWDGLRGYLVPHAGDAEPNIDPTSTTLAVRIKASGQLNAVSQKKINGIQTKVWPVYDGEAWTDQPTSNPAWNAIGWLVTQSNGALTYANFDLPKWLAFAAGCDERGDEANGLVNTERQLWDTAQAIMRTARAKIWLDPLTGLIEPYRDEIQTPSLIFCDGINAQFGNDKIDTPDNDTVTGVLVKFTDPDLWTERDGPIAGNADDPREVQFEFCTSWQKTWEEGSYEVADLRYRTQTLAITTEMEGLLGRLGGRVLLASRVKGWGQVAEVSDAVGSTLTLYPAPEWTDGMQHHVYLQGPEGAPGAKINCSRGGSDDVAVLASAPDVALRVDEDWRTLVAFGHDGDEITPADAPRIGIVTGGTAQGLRQMSLQFVLEDERVHADPGPAPTDPYSSTPADLDLPINHFEIGYTVLIGPPDEYQMSAYWDAVPFTYDTPTYEFHWRAAGTGAWTLASKGVLPRARFTLVSPVPDVIDIRVRATVAGYVGEPMLTTFHLDGSGPLTVYVSPPSISTDATSSTGTAAVLGKANGGSGTRTYSWSRVSGSTGITVDDATFDDGHFTATGLTVGETRTAVWKLSVTDDTATADSVPITVTIHRAS